jgi:hypothetical protein
MRDWQALVAPAGAQDGAGLRFGDVERAPIQAPEGEVHHRLPPARADAGVGLALRIKGEHCAQRGMGNEQVAARPSPSRPDHWCRGSSRSARPSRRCRPAAARRARRRCRGSSPRTARSRRPRARACLGGAGCGDRGQGVTRHGAGPLEAFPVGAVYFGSARHRGRPSGSERDLRPRRREPGVGSDR